MIKAIIFDMNGVIIDDEPLHERAFREVLEPMGIKLDHRLYQKHILGRSDLAGFQYLMEGRRLPLTLDELYKQKMKLYWQFVKNGIPLVPDSLETIKRLSASYRLALTTGATRPEMDEVFKQFGLAHYFTVTVTTEEFAKSKPDPEPYLLTLKKLGLPAAECVVIEDAVAGVKSAKAAGLRCIAIANSLAPHALILADHVVSSHNEITAELIQSLS
ncbi:MAG: HAD family phosphatase [Patescibacteria group bacterium]|jgi:HAD superfamily hydrolase (TIGR01509 family)